MVPHAVLALLLAASIAAPATGTAILPSEKLTDAEALAAAAGRILGAASLCGHITCARMHADIDRVNALLEKVIADDDELTSASQMFWEGVDEGGEALASGETDCLRAEAKLIEMERHLPP